MIEVRKRSNKKELLNDKTASSILRHILKFLDKEISYDEYKEIIYNKKAPTTKLQKEVKNMWDMIAYLFNNVNSEFNENLIDKSVYILSGKKVLSNTIRQVISFYNDVLSENMVMHIVDSYIEIYERFIELNEEERLIISIIFMNYLLVKNDYPVCLMYSTDLKKFLELKSKKQKEDMYVYVFLKTFNNKKYKKINTKDVLTKEEIYQKLKDEEQVLKELYKIKHLVLYGSYVKNRATRFSDIDVMAQIRRDMTYEEKVKYIEEAEKYLTYKLKKCVTISEYDFLIDDDNITTMMNNIKIF